MMRLAPGGRRYAAAAVLAAIPAFFVVPVVGLALVAAGAFVVWFYRDPERRPPPSGVVAPADGKVSVIRREGDRIRVGVYMSARDVHVNRAPLAGTVEAVEHTPGAHRPAFTKDSDRNERVHVAFDGFAVDLIAGAFARRITPYVEPGATVERGARLGHISFGSRADVVLPAEFDESTLTVSTGDRVRAGETIIAFEPRARGRAE